MRLERGDKTSLLVGDDISAQMSALHSQLEGRKAWVTPGRFRFETTVHNLRVLRSIFPGLRAEEEPVKVQRTGFVPFKPRMEPRRYQLENFHKFRDLHAGALFSLPGTGKTKTALDIISHRYLAGVLTGVVVLSSPKGVHRQWINRHIPLHLWEGIKWQATDWNGRNGKRPSWLIDRILDDLQFYSLNIDAVNSDKAYGALHTFCGMHTGKLMIIVDESDKIKSFSAKRSKRIRALADHFHCRQRFIMSGTPIAKDLTDEFSQFYFLDPTIIGHKYKSSFMAQYCRMGGWENRQVVGYRNLEQFKEITAPYIFRADKSELDLPEKVYDDIEFDLSDEQRSLLHQIKETLTAQTYDNDMIRAAHGAAALLRCQQIVNGFVINEDGEMKVLDDNPRLDALKDLLSHLGDQQVIIWCRFNYDISAVMSALPSQGMSIYGATKEKDRDLAIRLFMAKSIRYLVASPEAAGRGFDGLQEACSTAIYYSNSFNAVARWQSEDRIHRIGMTEKPIYYDLIAHGSPDRLVLRNLQAKKSLSMMVLDDVKQLIEEIE